MVVMVVLVVSVGLVVFVSEEWVYDNSVIDLVQSEMTDISRYINVNVAAF